MGLQLGTKLFRMQLTKAFMAKMSCNQLLLIDFAMYVYGHQYCTHVTLEALYEWDDCTFNVVCTEPSHTIKPVVFGDNMSKKANIHMYVCVYPLTPGPALITSSAKVSW